MNGNLGNRVLKQWIAGALILVGLHTAWADYGTITPSPYWKNDVAFPYDAFCDRGISKESTKWIKFTILREPYDPNVVYFQNCSKSDFAFHYSFAAQLLDPFLGMTAQQFNAVTLFEKEQRAVLGTVILPPAAVWPTEPRFREYGIQFVRQDPFTREQIRDLFNLVKSHVAAPADVQAFYFPAYEQQAAASANRDWFESQGIPLSSTARWSKGNACYSQGWAFGRLNYVPAQNIAEAYHNGSLKPTDILLTDGVPAEVPFVAGIVSLAPSTPNSHVAILSRTYEAPFVHVALPADAERAQQLVGRRIVLSAYENDYGVDVRILDTDGLLDETAAAEILQLKNPKSLTITPMASLGSLGVSTEGLQASDVQYVGGKAANFGILRAAVPDNSPRAMALTFDLWNAFLDQPLAAGPAIRLMPGEHLLLWADGNAEQGPTHMSFKLSKDGETISLFDRDGTTLLDSISFGPQTEDVSYGRSLDGGDSWQAFVSPTPGQPNSAAASEGANGLVINELMADNKQTIEDPCASGKHPDWIELYNASDETVALNGMYLTDEVNEPTQWQIAPEIVGPTLREEIARRLAEYPAYPPTDMKAVSLDMAAIRGLFTNANLTKFSPELRAAVIDALRDPSYGFDPGVPLRFRSSTNVEDSVDFVGAGLYDSYSGCLADAIDRDDEGPCGCDPSRDSEKDIFHAIRQVFASFYNDNAYLERLRRGIDETQVGMAVVVHHSFPDEIELANGVATLERNGEESNTLITLISQPNAASVTNPRDGSIPEEVKITILPSGSIVPPKLVTASSLVRLGDTVMTWSADYTELTSLLIRVSDEFARTTGKTDYILDVEYKKVGPGGEVLPTGGLVIKQVRQVPSPDGMQTPYLINQPTNFEVYPGEVALKDTVDVFADHRLKSRWTLQTRNTILDGNAMSEGLYTDVQIEYLDGDQIRTISGNLRDLPSGEHAVNGNDTIDSWQFQDLANPRIYHLRTADIPTAVGSLQRPILSPSDLGCSGYRVPYKFLALDVEYAYPVMSRYSSGMGYVAKNTVYLWACTPDDAGDILQERTLSSGGISIRSSFYYPPLPEGLTQWELGGGNTAPLKRWEQTTLEGLTTEPIVLKGYYSQTFRPEHHNLVEHFLFEPTLEPGISPDMLNQLKDRGVRFIHMILDKDSTGADESRILLYDFNQIPVEFDAN
jgi:hypothetical protein